MYQLPKMLLIIASIVSGVGHHLVVCYAQIAGVVRDALVPCSLS